MSYDMVQRLAADTNFRQRVQSCMYEQARVLADDPDPPTAWLANEQLKGNNIATGSMVAMIASFPSVAESATATSANGVEFLDQTCVADDTILSQVQSQWKTVANLFYSPPLPLAT
jgi:hypothetical protein